MLRRRFRGLALIGALALAPAVASAESWASFVTMSAIASNTLGRLCTGVPDGIGKYFDIACPSYAPSMTTAGDISVTGNLSAVKFLGDGSQLTGVTASAVAWDDIISIPNQVQQVSSSGSMTMASVSASTLNGHYISGTQGYFGTASVGSLLASGIVTASFYEGDGSRLTNLPAGVASAVAWDNIISIPDQVQQVSSSGSMTMASVSASTLNSHYLSSTQGYIGTLTANGAGIGSVNATRVSVTNDLNTLYLSATTAYTGSLSGNVVSATTVNGHYASFTTLTAGRLYGDGSGLTGITADATDRITSGTTRMVVVSDTGYVSLTQAGTNTGWFSPYTGLVTLGVSATGPISGSAGYFYGAVGIGTASPMATLQVGPGISDSSYEPAVMIRTDTFEKSGLRVQSGGGNASVIAAHRASDSAVIFDVKDNGKVGIGTDSPTWALTVKAQSGEYPATVLGNNDGMTLLALSTGATSGNTYSSIQAYNASGVTGGPLVLNGWQGNVGIHTTTPSRTLHVVGPDGAVASLPTNLGPKDVMVIENNANANIGLVAGAGAASALKFYEGGNNDMKGIIQFDHTSNLMTLAANNLVTTGLTLTPVGSVSVTDALQVGSSSLTCSPAIGGAIRYSSPSIQVCNGGAWATIAGGGGSSAVSSTGAIQFNAGSGFGGDTNNLYWDNGNKRLGVGTNAPNQQLTVSDTGGGLSVNIDIVADNTKQAQLLFRNSVSGTNAGAVSYNLANDNMNFRTAGVTNRMVIDSSGNVGIGTTTPDMKLSVDGSVRVNGGITLADYGQIVPSGTTTGINICGQSTGYPNGGCIVFRGANGGAGGTAEDGLEFLAGGNEKMRLTKTGSLGVGAAAPVAKLDVGGTISASDAIQVGSSSLTCNPSIGGAIRYSTPSIQVCNGGSWVSISSGAGGSAVSSTGAIQFNAGSGSFGGDTTNLYWDNGNKRLGVGTSNTVARFTVQGTSGADAMVGVYSSGGSGSVRSWVTASYNGKIGIADSSGSDKVNIESQGVSYFNGGNVGIGTTAPTATLQVSGSLIVSTSAQTSTPTLYVGTNGSVGIGTNAPGSGLHVDNGYITTGRYGAVGAVVIRTASGTASSPAAITTSDSWVSYISGRGYDGSAYREVGSILMMTEEEVSSSSSAGRITFNTTQSGFVNSFERMRIDSLGNIGINNVTPTAKLDVIGTISASDAIQVGGSSLTCSPAIGGAIRYSTPSIQVCNGGSWVSISSGAGGSAVSSTGAIQFNAGSGSFGGDTTNLYWDNGNKRLGIGTGAPLLDLHVSSSSNAALYLERRTGAANDASTGINFGLVDSTDTLRDTAYIRSAWSDNVNRLAYLDFYTRNSGMPSSPQMRIMAEGNVGIGTNTPLATLQVSGTTRITSWTTIAANVTPTTELDVYGTVSATNLRVANIVTATFYEGDGSRLTNLPAGVASAVHWDDIYSIPDQVQAVSDSGSMTMASVSASTLNSHYLSSTQGYIGSLTGNVVSVTTMNSRYLSSTQGYIGALTGATAAVGGLTVTGDSSQKNVSITNLIQMGTSTQSCSSTISGSIRYSAVSSTMEYCNSTAWVSMGPSSTQPVAFSAYGSGTQSVASNDSVVVALTNEHFDTNNNFASNRFTVTVPGKYIFTGQTAIDFSGASGEADVWLMLQKNGGVVRSGGRTITHPVNSGGVYPNITAIVDAVQGDYFELVAYQSNGGGGNQYLIGNRTYFSGALLVPQGSGSGGATALSGLSDVNTSGASTGSILAYNGSSWVVSSTVGATPAVSSTGAIQFNAGGGSFGGDTNNLYWDNGNKRLGLGTTAPAATLDVRGLGMVWVSGSTAGYNFVDRSVSDGYTTLYRNANKTRIYDNTGGDRLTIDNITGKVGIGTTNPRAPLDLSGTLYIDGRAGTNAASMEIGMGRTNSDYAYIDLIGDTTYTDYGLRLIRENTGANAVGRLENFGTGGLQLQTNHAAPIAFLTDAGTERMRIAADGKVGIGTAAPQATLQVSGNIIVGGTDGTNWVPLSVVKRASSTGYNDVGQFAVTNNAAGTNYTHLRLYQVETNKMGIEAANQDNTKGSLLLNPYGGFVGINTTAPTTALDVVSSSHVGIRAKSTSSAAISALALSNPSRHYSIMLRGDYGQSLHINDDTSATARMIIDTNGNVGIGMAPGLDKRVSAQANGSAYAAIVGYSNDWSAHGVLGYNNAWGVVCTGTSCGGNQAWTNYSDIRLKERIKPLPEADGLATIMKLKPVRFHWKDAATDTKKGEQLGFIAQDVEKLLPEVLGSSIDTTITTVDGKTTQVRDVKNLSYATLVVPLTKAVQELKAANDNLTIEIVGLKAANDTMRIELEALKKAVYGK